MKKDSILTIRLNEKDKELIRTASDKERLSMSTFMLTSVINKITEENK